jgi:hypothetical protein
VLDPVDDRWPALPGNSPAPVAGIAAGRRATEEASRPRDPVEDRWPALPTWTGVDVEPGTIGEEGRLRRLAHEQEGVPWSEWPS